MRSARPTFHNRSTVISRDSPCLPCPVVVYRGVGDASLSGQACHHAENEQLQPSRVTLPPRRLHVFNALSESESRCEKLEAPSSTVEVKWSAKAEELGEKMAEEGEE